MEIEEPHQVVIQTDRGDIPLEPQEGKKKMIIYPRFLQL